MKPLFADLEAMTSESAEPQDYVDLAEETEFHPEIQEGECSA